MIPREVSDFVQLAEAFCKLIETEPSSEEVLHDLHVVLARLYLGALLLPGPFSLLADDDASRDSPVTVERALAWHSEVVARFADVLGPQNFYREVFDPYAPLADAEVTGSLADDIADIYRHIRDGLERWRAGDAGNALFEWRFSFEIHWAEHATGALRALFARSAWHDLGWRPGCGEAP